MIGNWLKMVACAGLFALGPTLAPAADTMTLIVPFPPGGTTDVIARPLAADLGKALDTTVVVENKPGAAGNLGAQAVARSAPDGKTLLLTAAAIAVAPAMYENPGFKLFDTVQPVTIVGTIPFMLVVKKDLPVNSVAELLAYAKENPGKLNFGSGGNGTIVHLAGELLKAKTGLKFTHIPFRGGVQSLQEIVAGNVDFTIDGGPHVVQQIEAGTVKLLAVASDKRLGAYPDVPTIAEAGGAQLAGFEASAWQGAFVRGGTPKAIVETLNREIAVSTNAPTNRERLTKLGVVPIVGSVDETETFVKAEVAKWAEVVKAAGIKAQ
jgi:tripartite-type tricarboxylate transporter receptor subunit TctC